MKKSKKKNILGVSMNEKKVMCLDDLMKGAGSERAGFRIIWISVQDIDFSVFNEIVWPTLN